MSYDKQELKRLVAIGDVIAIKIFMNQNNLVLNGNKIVPKDKEALQEKAKFWDSRQQARKILLNSLYGTLLNEAFRMYDERLGQSVTLTGRSIVRHMNAKINELLTGIYDYKGEAIQYSDTDSSYFSGHEFFKKNTDVEWNRENIISFYDLVAEETNKTFPGFMQSTFNTTLERGAIIRAGRELVASRSLFIKKKKYAVLMYDKEGKRLDKDGQPGKLKVMGLDLKRADTPKYMQEFLENLLLDLLTGKEKSLIFEDIKSFRKAFKNRPGWEKGSPKKVADLTAYLNKMKKANEAKSVGDKTRTISRNEKLKINVPGHVRASMNWNNLCDLYKDKRTVQITDSSRIIVCKLRDSLLNMTSIAYPIDEPHLPDWFKNLPFDDAAMEETIIDNKILNIVGVLDWDLTDTKEKAGDDLFTF